MKFGEWLSSQLSDKKITMRELARASGVSHSTISGVISGKRNPTGKFCVSIAKGLGIDPDEVVSRALFHEDASERLRVIETSEISHMINDLSDSDRDIVIGVIKTLREQRKRYGA
jgi:transcriptional regulator with XRE-family HTH domain